MDLSDLQYYKTINNINPNSTNQLRDSFIQDMINSYNEAETNVITRFRVLVNSNKGKDVKVNGVPKRVLFKYKNSKDTDVSDFVVEIESEIGDVKGGDYVEYYDDKLNKTDTYLTISKAEMKLDSEINYIKYCNYTLKWMTDGVLYSMPAIVTNNTKYTLGIKNQSTGFTEADGMFGAIISYNDLAKKIPLGKRFIVNGQAWEATQLDHSSTPNILSILLGESSKSTEYDDIENEIADAFSHSYAITLCSTSESLIETATYKLIPIVTDNNTVISNATITYTSSDETIATVDPNGLVTSLKEGSCVITCSIGSVSTDLSLTVTAKTVTPVISYSCIWSNGTNLKTYVSSTANITKTVDSVNDTTLITNYSLDSVGTTLLNAGNITIVRKTNTSFQIKNVNVSTNKSFVIQFIDSSNGSTISTQTINLAGM